MRDPARIIRILNLVDAAWQASPDQRLTQLIYNLTRDGLDRPCPHFFYFEDDKLEQALRASLKPSTEEMVSRLQTAIALLATEQDEPSGRSSEEQIERLLYPEHFLK